MRTITLQLHQRPSMWATAVISALLLNPTKSLGDDRRRSADQGRNRARLCWYTYQHKARTARSNAARAERNRNSNEAAQLRRMAHMYESQALECDHAALGNALAAALAAGAIGAAIGAAALAGSGSGGGDGGSAAINAAAEIEKQKLEIGLRREELAWRKEIVSAEAMKEARKDSQKYELDKAKLVLDVASKLTPQPPPSVPFEYSPPSPYR